MGGHLPFRWRRAFPRITCLYRFTEVAISSRDSWLVGLICEKGNQLQVQSLRKGRTHTQKKQHYYPKNKGKLQLMGKLQSKSKPHSSVCCLFEAVITPRTLSSVNTRFLCWRKIAHPQSCATNVLHWNCPPKTYGLQQKQTSFFFFRAGDFGSLPFSLGSNKRC